MLASSSPESLVSELPTIFDDGSISLSCSLNPTSPDEITVTPYSIQLVTLPASAATSILALDDEFHSAAWWDLPEWMRRKKPVAPEPPKTIVVAKKVRRFFNFSLETDSFFVGTLLIASRAH